MKKLFLILLLFSVTLFPQKNEKLNINHLWGMERVGTTNLSPDGSKIVFTVSLYSLEMNRGNSDMFLLDIPSGKVTPLPRTEKSESEPVFSPDGKKIAYAFENQLWVMNADGTNQEKVTDLYSGVSGPFVWSQDGSKILFVSSIYPECDDMECQKFQDKKREEAKSKASIFTELMYRHWNDWRGDKRSHLFMYDFQSKEYTDLNLFSKYDVPPIALGSSSDYSFSHDGKLIAFTMNTNKMLATSTDNDIWLINTSEIKKGETPPYSKISISEGNDNHPAFSPDGKYIAYLSMERKGFEADKLRILVYDRESKKVTNLTKDLDRSASEIAWSPDSKTIYFTADNTVYHSIYAVDVATSKTDLLLEKGSSTGLMVSPDGKTLYFKHQTATLPYEIFSLDIASKTPKQLTFTNQKRLDRIDMNGIETFWSKGADGTPVQSILVKPPFFDPNKKYPMIFLIHGGPQGNWSDEFHYRWNYQMFAAAYTGYVVVATNPRGSTGYGQLFTDQISGDWGGKCYDDLMNAYDYAIANYPFIDAQNTFAAGASFGGYMINWIAGHTDRFNALVSHAGVFNLESMYGTTEELWFTEWEFGGTPWENRALYEKFSPHRYIHQCKTPMLVAHGAYDFRVPEEQAFQLFTSLQRLGVKSQFLYFPDETHFVAKPQNAMLWWNTVLQWFETNRK